MKRRRWQVDLRGEDELVLDRARRALGAEGDSETGRALLLLFTKLAAAVEHGSVISFLPADDPRAVDALPELTRALRPEEDYRWLVSVPHPWRKQLSIKGHRITVGQLVASMEANGDSIDFVAGADRRHMRLLLDEKIARSAERLLLVNIGRGSLADTSGRVIAYA